MVKTNIDNLRYIRDNWGNKSIKQMAEECHVREYHVRNYAARLRKYGLNLPKKYRIAQNVFKLVATELNSVPRTSRRLIVK